MDDEGLPPPAPAAPLRPGPAVTVDIVIFSVVDGDLKVLLVQRRYPPYQGMWAIPGGFVLTQESIDDAARRELLEETNVRDIYLEQLYTFGEPGRDPRGRVISVAYFALIPAADLELQARTDAADVGWHAMYRLPPLAFDHKQILEYALQRLRYKLEYTSIGFQLLPPKFTLTELQRVYEVILRKQLDKRNFRKKILGLGILKALTERKIEGPHRPAQLYRFEEKKFFLLREKGILFPF